MEEKPVIELHRRCELYKHQIGRDGKAREEPQETDRFNSFLLWAA